jgi:hypothetical protein
MVVPVIGSSPANAKSPDVPGDGHIVGVADNVSRRMSREAFLDGFGPARRDGAGDNARSIALAGLG